MDTFLTCTMVFLMLLASFNLFVGVSNDAVNFLGSALGSKSARYNIVMGVAAAGVLLGCTFSSGMMEIARSGIFNPQLFTYWDVMLIFIAVMLTDVLLLDTFNSLGLPTSTTVSIVFELLGASVVSAAYKLWVSTGTIVGLGAYINNEKALSIIIGILASVVIAFTFGTIIQWLIRYLFTFRYQKVYRYVGGVYSGLCLTAIFYFLIVKGAKGASFMTPELIAWLDANTETLMWSFFLTITVVFQILIWFWNFNALRIVILAGTFALAFAFAGNDLVNFVGVPLAAMQSAGIAASAEAANPALTPTTLYMGALKESVVTPTIWLIISGLIMVCTLWFSPKAQRVVQTAINLSASERSEKEQFGSTVGARVLVRSGLGINRIINQILPRSVLNSIDNHFEKPRLKKGEVPLPFDQVRASVNLVLASILIATATSMKLPLSTTYVTFMVAMGTSLADRAWGRDSAVFRITGVLSVIGGWFITAGAAFTICFFVTFVIYFGGTIAIVALIGLAVFMLIRSQVMYKKRKEKEKGNATIKQLMQSTDNMEILELLRKHTREELGRILEFTEDNFERTVTAFLHENLRGLRRAMGSVKFEKQLVKQMKRTGTLAMCRLDNNTVLEKGLYYYQGNDFASELVYSVGRLCEPCLEHIDNNFKPLDTIQKGEFADVTEDIVYLLQVCRHKLENNDYSNFEEDIHKANELNGQLAHLKREELQRIQSQSGSIKVSMVYLTMIQEAQNIVTYSINLMKVSRKFQAEE